jgi:2-dehydro-3-deoxyglucarate aldolase
MEMDFRARLRAGERLVGPMITLAVPETAEILAAAGYDWLFLDAEHGTFGTPELQAVIGRVDRIIPCLVRVAAADEVPIKKALDVGAVGIVAPQVNSPALAESVVKLCRYSPQGTRGVGLGRAHGYGLSFTDYVQTANETIAVIVQAEHIDAVENMEAIAGVPGVDAVLVGPYDLSASLGKIGEVDHPDVIKAVDHVTQVCRHAGVALGIFGVSASAVKPYIDKGYTLIIAGVDTVMLGQAGHDMVSQLK